MVAVKRVATSAGDGVSSQIPRFRILRSGNGSITASEFSGGTSNWSTKCPLPSKVRCDAELCRNRAISRIAQNGFDPRMRCQSRLDL